MIEKSEVFVRDGLGFVCHVVSNIDFLLLGLMYVKQENTGISQAHYNHLLLRGRFLW